MAAPDPNNPSHGFDSCEFGLTWGYDVPDPEPENFDVVFQPPLPALSQTMKDQFSRACIDVQAASESQLKQWSEKTTLSTPEFVRNFCTVRVEAEVILGTLPITSLYDLVGRDIPLEYNTDEFWIIHALGAFNSKYKERSYDIKNSANVLEEVYGTSLSYCLLIYNETIRDILNTSRWNQSNGPQPDWYTSSGRQRWTAKTGQGNKL